MTDHTPTATKKSQATHAQAGLANRSAFSLIDSVLAPIVHQQQEMMSFATMRLEKDREALKQMVAAKNFADAFNVQARWMRDCLSDYTAEIQKLPTNFILKAAATPHH